jgi:hypothetical protein
VQWGNRRALLCSARLVPTYLTAFFEAFLRSPPTCIRGEGHTVAEAERAAFAKFERQQSCLAHEFERGTCRNGSGRCRHCGLFSGSAFAPLERCNVCGTPTCHSHGVGVDGVSHWFCPEHAGQRNKLTHPNPSDELLE